MNRNTMFATARHCVTTGVEGWSRADATPSVARFNQNVFDFHHDFILSLHS